MSYIAAAVIGGTVITAGTQLYMGNKASSEQAQAAGEMKDMSAQTGKEIQAMLKDAGLEAALKFNRAGIEAAAGYKQSARAADAKLYRAQQAATRGLRPWELAGQEALDKYSNITDKTIDMIEAGPGEFEASPGYQFRMDEGMKALERSAAAKGRQLGGRQMKEVMRFGQGIASDEYGRFMDRYYNKINLRNQAANQLQPIVGMGYGASNTIADLKSRFGMMRGQNVLQGGVNATNAQLDAANNAANAELGAAQTAAGAMSGTSQQVNQAIMAKGAAGAGGYINAANAISGGVNSLANIAVMQSLMNSGGGSGGPGSTLPANFPGVSTTGNYGGY